MSKRIAWAISPFPRSLLGISILPIFRLFPIFLIPILGCGPSYPSACRAFAIFPKFLIPSPPPPSTIILYNPHPNPSVLVCCQTSAYIIQQHQFINIMQQIYNSSPFSIFDQFPVLAQNLENKSPELKPASDMDGGCGENKLGDKCLTTWPCISSLFLKLRVKYFLFLIPQSKIHLGPD